MDEKYTNSKKLKMKPSVVCFESAVLISSPPLPPRPQQQQHIEITQS